MNNNILIGAEGMDGANFLASCLTMSDKVYFNNNSFLHKTEYFFKHISEIEEKNDVPIWSDVSMLFSSCARVKDKISFSRYQSKSTYESVKFNLNNVSLISKVRLPISWPLMSLIEKDSQDPVAKLFESKYFIGLVNPDLFISLRSILGYPEFINYDEHNLDLLTVSEFNFLLSKDEQMRIKNSFRSNVDRLFDNNFYDHHKWNMYNLECDLDYVKLIKSYKHDNFHKEDNLFLKSKLTHEWDCNWFLSEHETVHNIKRLYFEMKLGNCNEKLIGDMYRVWIRKIDYIKKSHIKAFINTDDES